MLFIDENQVIYSAREVDIWGKLLVNVPSLDLDQYKDSVLNLIDSSITSYFSINSNITKIPLELWITLLDLYKYFLSIDNEICSHLYFSKSQNAWKILIPRQITTYGSLSTDQTDLYDITTGERFSLPSKDFIRVGDSHLHPMGLDKFSIYDDIDELPKSGFHILVYNKPNTGLLPTYKNFGHLGSFTFDNKRYYFDITKLINIEGSLNTNKFSLEDGAEVLFYPDILDVITTSYTGDQIHKTMANQRDRFISKIFTRT